MFNVKKFYFRIERVAFFRWKLARAFASRWQSKSFIFNYLILKQDIHKSLHGAKRIAIVALFPSNSDLYLDSLKNLFEGLSKNKYAILAVSNRDIDSSRLKLMMKNYEVSSILRKNVGRDFGAYQTGVLYLERSHQINQVEQLVLCNDTLIWGGNPQGVIEELSTGDFRSIWLNLEQNVHAHSFFLTFSNLVLTSKEFRNFWKYYLPSNSRNHAIHRGENGLTNSLLSAGFNCQPLVTPSYIEEKFRSFAKSNKNPKATLQICRIGRLFPGMPPIAPESPMSEKCVEFDKLSNYLQLFAFSDAPHRLALYFILFGDLPIKSDLYKFYNIAELRSVLNICNYPDAEAIEEHFLEKSASFQKSDSSTRKLRRLGEI